MVLVSEKIEEIDYGCSGGSGSKEDLVPSIPTRRGVCRLNVCVILHDE